jgi:hypothetical protein
MNPNELTPSLTGLDSIRHRTLATGEDSGSQSYPFRQGADPEMYQGDNPETIPGGQAPDVCERLGYESEATGILCSRTDYLAMMAGKLAAVGLQSAVVRGDGFSFTDRGVARLWRNLVYVAMSRGMDVVERFSSFAS